ncbi:unnamed protein product [Cylindrotheca closterium]|uniref:Calcineurin-like phosphoesterase domain-containing protein n=1 Tax=Cylindrotheca closterium TaxID=2856 RepID=A0AAD2FLL1_9STRA|nr:unnamed protein product [Cylindrotheca closterium]
MTDSKYPSAQQAHQWKKQSQLRSSSSLADDELDNNNAETSNHNYFAAPVLADNTVKEEEEEEVKSLELQASSPHLFSAGLVADVQYAPIPDGYSFSGNPRYYQYALDVAKHAFAHFNQDANIDDDDDDGHPHAIELVLNLGDTIDGKCQDLAQYDGDPEVISEAGDDPGMYAMNHVLDAMAQYTKGPILHTYGNHCLYNMDRKQLQDKLGIPFVKEPKIGNQEGDDDGHELVGYYSHLHKGIRFITVDSYDVGMLQRCPNTSEKRKQAESILRQHNPNYFKDDQMNSPEGMVDLEKRFVGFNGAAGEIQLKWLAETLEDARQAKEKVIILSHQPIFPGSSNVVCLMWNYDEVLSVLRKFSDIVVASLSGHAHKGGYNRDPESGIHFRVVEAVLENKPEKTYAIVNVHENELVIRGFGNCQSAVYDFKHLSGKWTPPLESESHSSATDSASIPSEQTQQSK